LASGSGMSAYYPIADIFIVEIYICYVPLADIASARHQRGRRAMRLSRCLTAASF
jgi:hypothetical protein